MTNAEKFVLFEHLERDHCANACARCSETSPDRGCKVFLELHRAREKAFTDAFLELFEGKS